MSLLSQLENRKLYFHLAWTSQLLTRDWLDSAFIPENEPYNQILSHEFSSIRYSTADKNYEKKMFWPRHFLCRFTKTTHTVRRWLKIRL